MECEALRQISKLPQEVVTDILSRLPIKSLLRFKCISNLWYSLISGERFTKTHLENSTKDPTLANHRILSVAKRSNYEVQHCSLCSLLFEQVTDARRNDFPIDKSIDSLKLLGTYNGLICILINRKDFFLWNPSTKESKKLPDLDGSEYISERGFGFDESNGDYKVYVVSSRRQSIGNIYSLKTNSWKSINNNFEDDSTVLFKKGKFVNGNLHWCRMKEESDWSWYITSFDLKNEVYGIVEQPNVPDDDFDPMLGVFDGCLSVFYHDQDHGYLDLWVLKQYGVRDSWSKLMRIPNDPFGRSPSLTPFYVTSENREVLFKSGPNLIIYDSKENRFRGPKMIGSNKFLKLVYVESLVPIVANIEER